MANLPEEETWEEGVYLIETTDPVEGGVNGVDNRPNRQLTNRTVWLKVRVDSLISNRGKIPVFSTSPSAPYEDGYGQGVTVIHQGNLYRANINIPPGPFSPSQWTKVILTGSTTQEGLLRLANEQEAIGQSNSLAISPGGVRLLMDDAGVLMAGDEPPVLEASSGSTNLGDLILQWRTVSFDNANQWQNVDHPYPFPNESFGVFGYTFKSEGLGDSGILTMSASAGNSLSQTRMRSDTGNAQYNVFFLGK